MRVLEVLLRIDSVAELERLVGPEHKVLIEGALEQEVAAAFCLELHFGVDSLHFHVELGPGVYPAPREMALEVLF